MGCYFNVLLGRCVIWADILMCYCGGIKAAIWADI